MVGKAGRSLGLASQGATGYAETMMDRTGYKVSQSHSCSHFQLRLLPIIKIYYNETRSSFLAR